MSTKGFALKRPCKNCPFRKDVPGYLRGMRAAGIARSLAEGAIFHCHETTVEVDPDENDGGDLAPGADSEFCAGALICLEKEGVANQAMRMAERLGFYDAARLDMDAPVVDSLVAFVDHHAEDTEDDSECCSVADAGCEAPAGYMVNGVVVREINDSGIELMTCEGCGEPVCENCMAEGGLCPQCEDWRETLAHDVC